MSNSSNNPSPQRELPVLLTVDVCDGAFDPGSRRPRFKGVMDTLPTIRDALSEAINRGRGGRLPVTWFVRADGQVAELTGSVAGLVRGWWAFWEECRDVGGEIAWHPHLYKRRGQSWIPVRDAKRLAIEAERIWRELQNEGWRPVACRMGESAGSTDLMTFLDSAGIRADASALPGRTRDDGIRCFDWQRTPGRPYHPARGDYRRPPRTLGAGDRVEGEDALSLLEVPFTMVGVRAPYDPEDPSARPPKRYIDLSYDPERLRRALSGQLKRLQHLVLVVHPLQATGKDIPKGDLVLGGIDVVRANLATVLDAIKQAGRTERFLTVTGFRRQWMGEAADEEEEVFPGATGKGGERRESRIERTKGGTRRSSMEGGKAVRRQVPSSGGVRGGSRRRRRAPRKRRG